MGLRQKLKAAGKLVLGVPVLYIARKLNAARVSAEQRALMRQLGGCHRDLEIVHPWDIRGPEHIYIGRNTFIGPRVLLIVHPETEIRIGDKVMFGPSVSIITSNHRHNLTQQATRDSGYDFGSVTIQDDVWVGAGAIILKGVTVGRGSVIGAGAVITKNIGEYEVWAGNPARKIRDRFQKSAEK